MTWAKARPYALTAIAAAGLITWAAAAWKLIAANRRPSPMRWIDYQTADGNPITAREYCNGPAVFDGARLWRWCNTSKISGKQDTQFRSHSICDNTRHAPAAGPLSAAQRESSPRAPRAS